MNLWIDQQEEIPSAEVAAIVAAVALAMEELQLSARQPPPSMPAGGWVRSGGLRPPLQLGNGWTGLRRTSASQH